MKFLPQRAQIEQFGNGGFRFAGMSHQGSLLVLPSGMRAWAPRLLADATADMFADFVAEKAAIDMLLIGSGEAMVRLPPACVALLQAEGIAFDVMATSPAIHTYNVVLAEDRRVAAAFIAVDKAHG